MAGCSIRGRVADVSGTPLRKVEVTLTSMGFEDRVQYVVTTRADGAFRIDDVEPAQYHLQARKAGYVTFTYGGGSEFNQGIPLTIAPDRTLDEFHVTLTPQAVITGRVLDPDGDPADGVQVILQREMEWAGERRLMPYGGQSITNDLGEFRLSGVAPGMYVLAAMAPPSHQFGRRIRQGPQETYPNLYYPDVLDPAEAQWINAPMGATVGGFELRLRRVAAFKVSGRVELPDDADPRSVSTHIHPTEPGVFIFGGGQHGGREFEFDGIQPGKYRIMASMHRRSRGVQSWADVEVSDRDVTGIVVRFPAGMTISGRIRNGGPNAVIVLNNLAGAAGPQGPAEPDGSFTLEDVPPGRYRVAVMNAGRDGYTKSVRFGGVEIDPEGFDIQAPLPLEIEIAYDGAIITGVVTGPLGASVQLRRGGASPHGAFTDQDGRFEIRAVAPGEYLAVATKTPFEREPSGGVPVKAEAGARIELKLAVE